VLNFLWLTYKIVELYLLFIWTISVREIYHKKMIHTVSEAKRTLSLSPFVTWKPRFIRSRYPNVASNFPQDVLTLCPSRLPAAPLVSPFIFLVSWFDTVQLVGTTRLSRYFTDAQSRHSRKSKTQRFKLSSHGRRLRVSAIRFAARFICPPPLLPVVLCLRRNTFIVHR